MKLKAKLCREINGSYTLSVWVRDISGSWSEAITHFNYIEQLYSERLDLSIDSLYCDLTETEKNRIEDYTKLIAKEAVLGTQKCAEIAYMCERLAKEKYQGIAKQNLEANLMYQQKIMEATLDEIPS